MRWLLKKIVHNEAMKTDPTEIYGWRVYSLAFSACFGAMSFGWDGSVIGGVIELEPFKQDYGLGDGSVTASVRKANLAGNIVSTLQCGCFAGALAASPLTDRWGRKWMLILAGLVIIVGVIFQAASNGSLALLYIGRFIAGLGVGAASAINPMYISENSPRAIRGFLTGLYQLFIVTGGMIAFWINYSVTLHLSGKTQYIVPLSVQVIPAVLLVGCMLLNPESSRWLARKDRWDEAKAGLARLRNLDQTHPYLESEFQEIAEQLDHERRLIGEATFKNLWKEMWTIKGNRNRAIISIMLMVCQQFTGVNAVNTYAPTILKALGLTGTTTALFGTGIYGIVKVSSCIVFLLFMADSLGRRRSLLWTSIALGMAMFYIGLYVRIDPPLPTDTHVPPQGYVALVCIYLYAAFFQFGWGPACWILISEIPTARLRSMNVALGAATQWLFNLIVSRVVPNMLATVGDHGYGTYLIFGSFCFSMFFFVWFFIPETKGISLEAMDELFGVAQLEKKDSGSENGDKPEAIEISEKKIEVKAAPENQV